MKEQKVWFENLRGQKICGLLYLQEEKSPAILMVHGMLSWTDKHEFGEFVEISKRLQEAGYSTLRFDFSGHGESDGDHVDVSVENYKDDMKCALDFLFEQNIDKDNVGVLANSFGGVVTIMLNDERVKVMMLNSPPVISKDKIEPVFSDANPNWEEEVNEKGYFIYKKYDCPENRKKVGMGIYNFSKKTNLLKEIKKVKKPIYFFCAELDGYLSVENGKELFESANEPKKFILMKGAEHCSSNKVEELTKLIIEFFDKWLK